MINKTVTLTMCWKSSSLTMLILFVFGCLFVLSESKDDPPITDPKTTVPVTKFTRPTIDPSKPTNYSLDLSYSGPAVLDSNINFTAKLFDHHGHLAQSKYFIYEWFNNANRSFEELRGQYQSSVIKVFSSEEINRGEYLMTVSVYEEHKKYLLAYAALPFVLTDKLNGILQLNQSLVYQRNKTIFSTGTIQLKLNMTDKFDRKASHEYFWYLNNEFKEYTAKPEYSLEIMMSGNHTIEARVYVILADEYRSKKRLKHRLSENTCDNLQNTDKCGRYIHPIMVKDKLTILSVVGGTSVAVNGFITINATCAGSSPTGICWNTTILHRKQTNYTSKCVPKVFKNTSCFHRFDVQPKEKGWHNVAISVYNDVSFLSAHYYVFAYNPDSHDAPMITIPVMFSVLGIVIIVIGGVYLWKMKKKPYIEVADFEFHPSIARNDSYVVFSDVLGRMKKYMKKNNNSLSVQSYDSAVSNRQSHQSSAAVYDTL